MNQPQARKLTKKGDWLIIGTALVALLVILFLPQFGGDTESGKAVISVDGKTVSTIELNVAEEGEFQLEALPEVRFSIRNGKIAILNGNCPDHICERTGYINRAGESIICLPNRIIVQIEGNSSVDAIVR